MSEMREANCWLFHGADNDYSVVEKHERNENNLQDNLVACAKNYCY